MTSTLLVLLASELVAPFPAEFRAAATEACSGVSVDVTTGEQAPPGRNVAWISPTGPLELSTREIGERMSVGKSAVTMRLERFRSRMREELVARAAGPLGAVSSTAFHRGRVLPGALRCRGRPLVALMGGAVGRISSVPDSRVPRELRREIRT